jgi:hypothetical protein
MALENIHESGKFPQDIELLPKPELSPDEEQLLRRAVVRLSGQVLGIVLGVIAALGIFIATNWLVIKGGDVVGPHLGLLSQFFIGYSVTFVGSLVGAAYGFVVGYLTGLIIGWVYNAVVFLRFGPGK